MRQHADFYKQFVDVNPGGGVRRNPKRKNAGAFSTPFSANGPTPEEVTRVFEGHLAQMAQGGTYGDNMEITAFCRAFNVDVKIYQRDFAYMVPVNHARPATQVAHIAYHVSLPSTSLFWITSLLGQQTWEHYSSIRNLTGPHAGPPMVKNIPMSAEAQKEAEAALAKSSYVLPWMVTVVMESLPFCADRAVIHKTLEECKGSVDLAVSKLLDSEYQSSSSSRRGSSSVEREPDSDDDSYSGPNKKQDRRLSRAKRTTPIDKDQQSSKYLSVRLKGPHLPLTQESSSASESHKIPIIEVKDGDETEEEDWLNKSPCKDSESASVSTSASEYSIASNPRSGGVRLKLSLPKKRDENNHPLAAGPPSDLSLRNEPVKVPTNTTQQRTFSPKKRLMSRNQRDMMKKTAQKAAAKERKRETAAARVPNQQNGHLLPTTKKGKENTPAIETHIKVLYI